MVVLPPARSTFRSATATISSRRRLRGDLPRDQPRVTALAQARRALDYILRQQEPYPALVLDRH